MVAGGKIATSKRDRSLAPRWAIIGTIATRRRRNRCLILVADDTPAGSCHLAGLRRYHERSDGRRDSAADCVSAPHQSRNLRSASAKRRGGQTNTRIPPCSLG